MAFKVSLDKPKILTPKDLKSEYLSLNSFVSLVHPEVLSFGYIYRTVHCPSKSVSSACIYNVASKLKLGSLSFKLISFTIIQYPYFFIG